MTPGCTACPVLASGYQNLLRDPSLVGEAPLGPLTLTSQSVPSTIVPIGPQLWNVSAARKNTQEQSQDSYENTGAVGAAKEPQNHQMQSPIY